MTTKPILISGQQIRNETLTNDHIAVDAGISVEKLSSSVILADGSKEFTGKQSLGNNRLTDLGDPMAAKDAVNLGTLSATLDGLRDYTDEAVKNKTYSLDELTDVETSSAVNEQFLKFNNGKWSPSKITESDLPETIKSRTYYFDIPSMRWEIKHGLHTTDFVERIRNSSNLSVYANIIIVSRDEFWVEFSEPESGKINVIFDIS